MRLVIDVPSELEEELAGESARLGLSLSEYVLRLLAGGRDTTSTPTTGAELLAYWQREGLVGTRPDISDAPVHARTVREQAQNRPQP